MSVARLHGRQRAIRCFTISTEQDFERKCLIGHSCFTTELLYFPFKQTTPLHNTPSNFRKFLNTLKTVSKLNPLSLYRSSMSTGLNETDV